MCPVLQPGVSRVTRTCSLRACGVPESAAPPKTWQARPKLRMLKQHRGMERGMRVSGNVWSGQASSQSCSSQWSNKSEGVLVVLLGTPGTLSKLHQDQSESLSLLLLVQCIGWSTMPIRKFSLCVPLEVKMQSWSQKKWEKNMWESKSLQGGKDGRWEGLFSCEVIYISRWEPRSVTICFNRFWKHKS